MQNQKSKIKVNFKFNFVDIKTKQLRRERRRSKIRAKIRGTARRPRVVVFRSNRHLYLQAVNDEQAKIICQASDFDLARKAKRKQANLNIAKSVGKLMAELLKKKKITQALFDRAGYKYHGQVRAAAEGLREGGLVI